MFLSKNLPRNQRLTIFLAGIADAVQSLMDTLSMGMTGHEFSDRLNQMTSMLPLMQPQDTTETMLLGQFIALQESGLRCLGLANRQEGLYHQERYFVLSTKLLNTANQTMQALLKYRTRGQQTVQVIHVHNEGQAIVAQNVGSPGGPSQKS